MNNFFMHNLPNLRQKKLTALPSLVMLNALLTIPMVGAHAATANTTAKTQPTVTTVTTVTKATEAKKATKTTKTIAKASAKPATKPATKSTKIATAATSTSKSPKTLTSVKPTAQQAVKTAPSAMAITDLPVMSQVEAISATSKTSQDQVIDGVVALVNDTPILRSQLDRAVAQASAQLKAQNKAVPPTEQLASQVLDQLITKQIQLDLIKRQGVQADENAVNTALINLARQNGIDSLADFQQKLDAQRHGSYQAVRQKVSEDLAIQTLEQQQLVQRIKISDQDIDNFFQSPDSNALAQAQYRTLHIRVPFKADATGNISDKQKNQALAVANQIAKALQSDNANIEQIMTDAQRQYDMQIQGGDMGYHLAAELPSQLSESITALAVGQVTAPISTAEGYNVIKLVDKRGGQQKIMDQWHTRHILISPSTALSPELAKQQIDAIYDKLRQGADFATLASTYSKDPGSANNGGDLGWVSEGDMVPAFEAMMKQTPVNDFSVPFQSQFGWHILKVDEKRQKDMTDVYRKNIARDILYQRMAPKALADWMQELRSQAYVKIMP